MVEGVSKALPVIACAGLAVFYVAILYAPALILRLPPPTSYKSYMIRRFVCAAFSSVVSVIVTAFILRVKWNAAQLAGVYGIRLDHLLEALVLPVSLTSLLYSGSFLLKFLKLLDSYEEHQNYGKIVSVDSLLTLPTVIINWMLSVVSNISTWRNLIVAPLTEELVFRACMIPLLFCGGLSTYTAMFLCPILFSLAHLNHLLEHYAQMNFSLLKAAVAVGFQLGYTVVFGSYASFVFIRTGHLIAPLVCHIFCNYMGIPAVYSQRKGIVTLAAVAGLLGFLWLLFPLTSPHYYNDNTDDCECWHRYCKWG